MKKLTMHVDGRVPLIPKATKREYSVTTAPLTNTEPLFVPSLTCTVFHMKMETSSKTIERKKGN